MNDRQRIHFLNELLARLEPLQQWAIDCWPDKEHPLSRADFSPLRREILALGQQHGQQHHLPEPEPEQGGPQYINENPAPWP